MQQLNYRLDTGCTELQAVQNLSIYLPMDLSIYLPTYL
jgi:hypothetical protein